MSLHTHAHKDTYTHRDYQCVSAGLSLMETLIHIPLLLFYCRYCVLCVSLSCYVNTLLTFSAKHCRTDKYIFCAIFFFRAVCEVCEHRRGHAVLSSQLRLLRVSLQRDVSLRTRRLRRPEQVSPVSYVFDCLSFCLCLSS